MLTAATMFASAIASHDYTELDQAVYGLLSYATREPRVLTLLAQLRRRLGGELVSDSIAVTAVRTSARRASVRPCSVSFGRGSGRRRSLRRTVTPTASWIHGRAPCAGLAEQATTAVDA